MVSDFSLFFLKHVQLILSKAFSLCVIYTLFAQTATLCDFHLGKELPSQDTDSKGGHALPALCTAGARKCLLDVHRCVTNPCYQISILQCLQENKN